MGHHLRDAHAVWNNVVLMLEAALLAAFVVGLFFGGTWLVIVLASM